MEQESINRSYKNNHERTPINNKITIFSDGACAVSTKVGGWGSIIKYSDGSEREMSGGERATTNNRMELEGVIKPLQALPCTSFDILIISDSQYVVKGISEWLPNWKKNNWTRKVDKNKREDIKNKDLWQELDRLINIHTVKTQWVRGHDGHPENERCDKMACKEIEKIKNK